jgi:anaerobic magnesium-protoporphyrin IX monomethyl ester cyclase
MKKIHKIMLFNSPMDTNIGHIPYGLSCLKAYLKKYAQFDLEIEIIDGRLWENGTNEIAELLLKKKPYLIGMSCLTIQADTVYEITKKIKERDENVIVVHGGWHSTALPELSINSGCDYVVFGEGEVSFTELVNALLSGKSLQDLKGIAYIDDQGKIIRAEDQPLIQDINDCPIPAYDGFNLSDYKENIHVDDKPCAFIMCSRGCPFDCAYCCSVQHWKRRIRFRTVDNIMDEMNLFHEKHDYIQFHFFDDDFLTSAKLAESVAQAIMQTHNDWSWVIQSRCDSIIRNQSLLPLLKEAGCQAIEMGIESINSEVLKKIDKEITIDQIINAINVILDARLVPLPLIMTCNVGETLETHYMTNIEFLKIPKHPLTKWCESFTTAFPGTKYYNYFNKYGMLLSHEWTDFHPNKINFVPFSLLNDIPVTRVPRPGKESLKIFNRFLDQIGLALTNNDAVFAILDMCQGDRNVHDVINEFPKQFFDNDIHSKRFALRTMIIAAWLGVIESKNSSINVKPVEKLWLDHFSSQDHTWV